jgi:hypothetical protein
MKHVAFEVTPSWWHGTSPLARQLIIAAAVTLVPQRLGRTAHIFTVGRSVFAYDVLVRNDATTGELTQLRAQILAEMNAVQDLLPSAWFRGAVPTMDQIKSTA